MTVGELITYLGQFDPKREVWVIYDTFCAYPADFAPVPDNVLNVVHRDGVHPGDLIMEVG